MNNDISKLAPSYKRFAYVMQPGEIVSLTRQGNQLSCLESNAAFKLRIDNAPETDFEAGLQLRAEVGFSDIQIRNTSAAVNTIVLGISKGDLSDNRSSFAGAIEVQDTAGNSFAQVLTAITALRTNREADSWLDFAGYTTASYTATTTIVASGANTGGIDILMANMGGQTLLSAGGTQILSTIAGTTIVAQRIRIPAAQALTLSIISSGRLNIAYKVL